MNTYDIDIELPPLPDIPADICYWDHSEGVIIKLLQAYATAAIEADRKTTEKQLNAYRGLVNSMETRLSHLQTPHDELKKSTDPGLLASERAANAMLTEELEAVWQASGEPVGTLSRSADESIKFTPFVDLHVTDGMLVYTAPQIPEGYRLQPLSEFDAMMDTRTIPEGYKLVPIEPTDEMIEAAWPHHEGEWYLPVSLYKAMLKAAPEPKGQS